MPRCIADFLECTRPPTDHSSSTTQGMSVDRFLTGIMSRIAKSRPPFPHFTGHTTFQRSHKDLIRRLPAPSTPPLNENMKRDCITGDHATYDLFSHAAGLLCVWPHARLPQHSPLRPSSHYRAWIAACRDGVRKFHAAHHEPKILQWPAVWDTVKANHFSEPSVLARGTHRDKDGHTSEFQPIPRIPQSGMTSLACLYRSRMRPLAWPASCAVSGAGAARRPSGGRQGRSGYPFRL